MSTHKSIDRICCIIIVLALLLTGGIAYAAVTSPQEAEYTMGYETRLFDTGKVHIIDIQMDDWDSFIASCEDEAYAACTVIIDNEVRKNVAIRAKGNTSLRNVSQLGSERYSFKIEFDHYETGKTYYGLDKLSLNNLIQDNTMMKDYLSYQLMGQFGVNAPLSSYAYVTVNGEDWGLYLAVEGIEDAFLERNNDGNGELYKPDSMDMGGGRGNGRDFDMNARAQEEETLVSNDEMTPKLPEGMENMAGQIPGGRGQMPGGMPPEMPEGMENMAGQMPGGRGQMPGGMPPGMPEGMENMADQMPQGTEQLPEGFPGDWNGQMPSELPEGMSEMEGRMPGGMFGGNGSADVKLQYIDDDPDSYSNIFGNAKTDITMADQSRLIASLKSLSAGENIPEIVDMDGVMRYFVVHNYLCNGDSYTGGMIHNYYLYENEGKLSMLPWDYNLAFGGFQSYDATSTVNDPIDSPVSGSNGEDRPMVAWIFDDGEYQAQYHALFAEFLNGTDIAAIIDAAEELIEPYVERDPSKFCSYEEFKQGVETLRTFCGLRTQSIRGQLDGSIPSTTEGQNADSTALIDASSLTIADMGSMEREMGAMRGPFAGNWEKPEDMQMPSEGEMPPMDFPMQGMQMPEEGFITPGDGMVFPVHGGRENTIGAQAWIMLGGSAAVLVLGLLLTRLFRRK